MSQIAMDINAARKQWGWYLALGIVLILAGIVAIWAEGLATLTFVTALGFVLLVAGVAQIIGAFVARGVGQVILTLLVGALDIIVGLMLMEHPVAGALTITLLIAALLVFGGIFRFVSALVLRFPQHGWVAISGVIGVVLGILLWMQWPVSALWFLGFAVGVNLIFAGVAWSSFAFKLKG
jgi:uncharacterized membrane protein HdeD (DUF308 family)